MDTSTDIKSFLDEMVLKYNTLEFIETDPIQIPHTFTKKEDIEIAGFLTATISWGNRKMILRNAQKMMQIMGLSPFDFVMSASESHLLKHNSITHRTFNAIDFEFFVQSLRNIYLNHGGLEAVFTSNVTQDSVLPAITAFKKLFFSIEHPQRTLKHVSDPSTGSASKRINMMLRWFVRQDSKGVDLGIWTGISPSILSCPLDVHSGTIARQIGILSRKQNDVKALNELDSNLRTFDPFDPVKYDYALFGLGVFDKI